MSRKKNEAVMIGESIKIVIVEIRGDKVRLGFDVPKEIPCHRLEVYDAIRRNRDLGDDETTPPGMSQPEVE